MSDYKIIRNIFQKNIKAEITVLDRGIHVLLTGGDQSHIGAVCLANESGVIQILDIADNEEGGICKKWVEKIYGITGQPVSVTTGILSDDLTRDQIYSVMVEADDMLLHALEFIKIEKTIELSNVNSRVEV